MSTLVVDDVELKTATEAPESKRGDPSIPYGPERLAWGRQVPPGARVTAPSEDPVEVYPQVPPKNVEPGFPKIDYPKLEIPPGALTRKEREKALKALRRYAETQQEHFTGFQANQDQCYSRQLSWLLDMHSNNLGDPFKSGYFTLNFKSCERSVLDYFAALWNVDWPHRDVEHDEDDNHDELVMKTEDDEDHESYWGYVLSMGSTEANISKPSSSPCALAASTRGRRRTATRRTSVMESS